MRIVFLGTPQFAVPTLEAIRARGDEIVAVYTQPDRPKGRGGQLSPSPVKETALRLKIPIQQPERIRRPENVEALAALKPDVMVVVGYGQIIPQSIIDIPPHGILNVHASLLPKYRGAAPIQWAIANGERETGVTIMRIDAGLDTGDMMLKWRTDIGERETAPELSVRLATAGAALLTEALAKLERGEATFEPQDNTQATYAPILKKEDGAIDWSRPAREIYNRLRGFKPWPGAYTTLHGETLQIFEAAVASSDEADEPGTVQIDNRRWLVNCGSRSMLEVLEVQLQGRKRMPAASFLNGFQLKPGERLGGTS